MTYPTNIKTRLRHLAIITILGALVLVNVLAYFHARSMTVFTALGERTPKPETLTFAQKLKTVAFGVTIPKSKNIVDPSSLGLVFETITYPSSSGYSLEAWRIPAYGSTKTVLLFHGYGASKQSLLPMAQLFHQSGFSCVLVDFYGSGSSSGKTTSIGFHEAKDVISSFEYVHSKWPDDQIIIYSLSMGSAAVLNASQDPKFHPSALLLESPFDSLLTTTRNRFSVMKVPSLGLAELLVFWGGFQQNFNGFEHNPAQYASYVTVPTLLLYGEKDPRVQPEERKSILKNLHGIKKLIEFEGIEHQAIAEMKPQEWLQSVLEFLNQELP